LDEKEKKDEPSALRPYVKPLLIVHGALTFLATHATNASALIP
jgi:hypothetical protein